MHRSALAFISALACLAISATLTFAPPAGAAEREAYTPAAMHAAQATGKPVIVHVTAPWCSTCAAQVPIVLSLLNDPRFKDLVLLTVDFDSQKSVLRQYGVRAQSTFIAFKGGKEVARSTGDTDRDAIEMLFEKTS